MKKISKEEKELWLEDWRQSGKKAWTYARENGLVPQTFVSWTKPRDEKKKTPFVEVPAHVFQPARLIQEVLIEKGDIKIHIPLEPVLCELHTILARLGQRL
jgi:hypothetical protein